MTTPPKTDEEKTLKINEQKWTKPLIDAGWICMPSVIIERQAALGLEPSPQPAVQPGSIAPIERVQRARRLLALLVCAPHRVAPDPKGGALGRFRPHGNPAHSIGPPLHRARAAQPYRHGP